MKLYHGTSAEQVETILRDGLKPRGDRPSLWPEHESRPDAVYLTNCYAPSFAHQADLVKGAIVEIDTDFLKPEALCPDEDALEQLMRGHDKILPTTLVGRTKWYRTRLQQWAGGYQYSLNALGTCCHIGPIPPEAILRIVTIDWNLSPMLAVRYLAGEASLMNYRFFGAEWRGLTQWIFGDPIAKEDAPTYYHIDPSDDNPTAKAIQFPSYVVPTILDRAGIQQAYKKAQDDKKHGDLGR